MNSRAGQRPATKTYRSADHVRLSQLPHRLRHQKRLSCNPSIGLSIMFSFSSYRAAYITKSDYPLIPIFTVYLLQHAQEVRVKFGQTCPLVVVGQEPDPSPALERVEQGELRLVRGDINHLVFRQVVLFTPKNEQHDRRHETERRSLHAQYTKKHVRCRNAQHATKRKNVRKMVKTWRYQNGP